MARIKDQNRLVLPLILDETQKKGIREWSIKLEEVRKKVHVYQFLISKMRGDITPATFQKIASELETLHAEESTLLRQFIKKFVVNRKELSDTLANLSLIGSGDVDVCILPLSPWVVASVEIIDPCFREEKADSVLDQQGGIGYGENEIEQGGDDLAEAIQDGAI